MLPMIPACRKTGGEPFHAGGVPLGFDLASFWQWLASDLLEVRSSIAEYIVARALGLGGGLCAGWGSHDLQTLDGLKIEVKSSGYLQAWAQRRPTQPRFSIKAARCWDPTTGEMSEDSKRQADLYVFALHAHQDQATLDPLDVRQWRFFVVPACDLPNGKSIGLAALQKLQPRACSYAELAGVVQDSSRTCREPL